MTVKLGQRVRDKVTHVEGIVTARTEYLYGCTRIQIQQPVGADGKLPDPVATDEPQVDIIGDDLVDEGELFRGTAPAGATAGRHGDRPATPDRTDPATR